MDSKLNEIIGSFSFEELLIVREKIEERINRTRRAEQNAAKKKILEMARLHGIDISFQEEKAKQETITTKKEKLPPKYRNPEHPDQTWPGHGKKPAWLTALLADGYKLEQFIIIPEHQA